ncbi:MAG: hypothetical protein AAF541_22085 [Pseudomonadota bacterium]
MKTRLLVLCVLGMVASSAFANQIVVLSTGTGSQGEASNLTFLAGPSDGPFASPFSSADFASARSGDAGLFTNRNGFWATGSSLGADWISTKAFQNVLDGGGSALFALDFQLTDNSFTSATLTLNGGVDNSIGVDATVAANFGLAGPVQGVYLNGSPLSGDSILTGGIFSAPAFSLQRTDVASLLVHGTNTLYVYMADTGGPSGLAFTGTLDVIGTTVVPLPAGVWLFGTALALLGGSKMRNSRFRRT